MAHKVTKKKRTHGDYHEYLLEKLQDPEYAFLYLKAAYEDEDPDIFSMAVQDVLEARGMHQKNNP